MGPSPGLPATSPRILVVGPSIAGPDLIATYLKGLFDADPSYTSTQVVSQKTDTAGGSSLAGFWYSPTNRDARLSILDGVYTWVVLLDGASVALDYPELSFEGTRNAACRARAAGAQPVVLMSWSTDPAETVRRGEMAYRIGNGTGCPVVPAGFAWNGGGVGAGGGGGAGGSGQVPAGPNAGASFVAAASLYSAFSGKSAVGTSYSLPNVPAEQETAWLSAAADAVTTHATTSHYQAPFASAVKLETAPDGPTFAYMDSGTSSEAIWETRMTDVSLKVGLDPKPTAIGACNATKTFDATCLATATQSFASTQYRILYARDYSIPASMIVAAGKQTDLTVQVWDRHYDGLPNDGLAAVDALEERSMFGIGEAHQYGLAWTPHHISFAKLKTARPMVQLTSDGTHATYPVGYALAAMSVFSRTSRVVPTAGLDADTAAAVGYSMETIRHLSAMSQWGTFVADDPATRPKVLP
jgi:hypothetical protein